MFRRLLQAAAVQDTQQSLRAGMANAGRGAVAHFYVIVDGAVNQARDEAGRSDSRLNAPPLAPLAPHAIG